MHRSLAMLVGLAALLLPGPAGAWWNSDWEFRRQVTLQQSGAGEAVFNIVVPVRLHVGNFMFADASATGADLRFVAGDDKTPLKYHVARYDATNELAFVWVQLPKAGGGAPDKVWMYYGNKRAPAASDPGGSYDPAQTAVFHFSTDDPQPRDATAYGNNATASGVNMIPAGVVDAAAAFDGKAAISLAPSPAYRFGPGAGFTFSAWVKLDAPQKDALLFLQQDGVRYIRIGIAEDRVVAQVTGPQNKVIEAPREGRLVPGKWQHLAVTLSNRLIVYVDGSEVASVAAEVPELAGSISIGGAPGQLGLVGALDEVQLSKAAQSPAWVRAVATFQVPEGSAVVVSDLDETKSGGGEYLAMLALLASFVTFDGWVVVGVIVLLAISSFEVMARKAMLLRRTERADQAFMHHFRQTAGADIGTSGDLREFANSTLYRIYRLGLKERDNLMQDAPEQGSGRLSPEALQAVRATLGAEMVREATRLNGQMVMLTLSISGAPFLGLLGTVIGIMITFGTIALAGDVNVNTIAPGVAAALICTVAGLIVAIPVLFGYNFLTSHIKDILARMEVFAEELVGKFAVARAR